MSGPFTRTGSWQLAWQRLVDNRAALVAAIILGLLSLAVIVGPWLSPYTLDETDWDLIAVAPDLVSGHWFGTDALGRDILVRSLEGGRISLLVGVVATLVSLVVGVSWGAIAGYIGGRVDSIMMRTVDVLYAMPFMFFVILLMVMFERNILLIFVAIGAINWLDMARIVRGQTISLKTRDFVAAARCMGASTPAILLRHILPNLLGIVVVYVTLTIPQAILVESFLSFLGLGVQEPMTSGGALVNEGVREMEGAPWMLLFPATLLALTLFCFNFLGDGLRDALDPRERL